MIDPQELAEYCKEHGLTEEDGIAVLSVADTLEGKDDDTVYTKNIDIGGWDMSKGVVKRVPHHESILGILEVSFVVKSDDDTHQYMRAQCCIDHTDVILEVDLPEQTAHKFSDPLRNRGWVTITYRK
jgi:hypothetical protein